MSCAKKKEMVVMRKFQGWYHQSRETLAPTLESQNEVLHMIRYTKQPPSETTLSKVRRMQHKVDEAIEIAKTRCSRNMAQTVQNMPFQPKEAWANTRLLIVGEKIHHSSSQYIHMRLPSYYLEETDEVM